MDASTTPKKALGIATAVAVVLMSFTSVSNADSRMGDFIPPRTRVETPIFATPTSTSALTSSSACCL
jgi:hypothetical protein